MPPRRPLLLATLSSPPPPPPCSPSLRRSTWIGSTIASWAMEGLWLGAHGAGIPYITRICRRGSLHTSSGQSEGKSPPKRGCIAGLPHAAGTLVRAYERPPETICHVARETARRVCACSARAREKEEEEAAAAAVASVCVRGHCQKVCQISHHSRPWEHAPCSTHCLAM